MPSEIAPTSLAEAIEWIGSRSGYCAMQMHSDLVVISVRVGNSTVIEIAPSLDESPVEGALIRAIQRIVASVARAAE